jgi:NADH:ubiquinone oxidoreductase subunit 6 (subunit J)
MIENSTKKALSILGNIIIIFGTIGAFIIAAAYGYTTSGYSSRMERNWGLTIFLFITFLLSSLILGVLLKAIAEIVESLEIINNNIANIGTKLPGNQVDETYLNPHNNVSIEKWICPTCGKQNALIDKYCVYCGGQNPSAK